MGRWTTAVRYYTAGAHPNDPQCGNKPWFADLVCTSGPLAQPSSGPTMPTTRMTYNIFGQTTTKTDTSSSDTRTSTVTYNGAGRPTATGFRGRLGRSDDRDDL